MQKLNIVIKLPKKLLKRYKSSEYYTESPCLVDFMEIDLIVEQHM